MSKDSSIKPDPKIPVPSTINSGANAVISTAKNSIPGTQSNQSEFSNGITVHAADLASFEADAFQRPSIVCSTAKKGSHEDLAKTTKNSSQEALNEENQDQEELSEVCPRSPASEQDRIKSKPDVLKSAIDYLCSEFGFDRRSCDELKKGDSETEQSPEKKKQKQSDK